MSYCRTKRKEKRKRAKERAEERARKRKREDKEGKKAVKVTLRKNAYFSTPGTPKVLFFAPTPIAKIS